jgi:hypothetical protein
MFYYSPVPLVSVLEVRKRSPSAEKMKKKVVVEETWGKRRGRLAGCLKGRYHLCVATFTATDATRDFRAELSRF